MMLADSHTHLDEYPREEVPEILERAGDVHVGIVVCAGTSLGSSQRCIELSRTYDECYAGGGYTR